MQRRTILGMLAATPVVVAACSDNDTGGDGAGAQVAADVVPQMVPLSALMKVRKMVPAGDVVISEIKPQLKESFDLVGFDRLFRFYEDDLHAVGSF